MTHDELQSMMGFFTYYRRFIPCYSKKVNPLNDLKNATDKPYVWTMGCEAALAQIKHEFANSVKLAFPHFSKEFYLETGALRKGLGACLSQKHECPDNPKRHYLHPTHFASRTMNDTEKNYSATELEALGVCYVLRKFEHILMGRDIRVCTDHMPLTYLYKMPTSPNQRLNKFIGVCCEYGVKIFYRKGN